MSIQHTVFSIQYILYMFILAYFKFNAPMKNGVRNAISGHLEGMKSQNFPGLWGASHFSLGY